MHPEALILRRCYPVPVTFADLRAAFDVAMTMGRDSIDKEYRATLKAMARGEVPPEPSTLEDFWPTALKQVTGALDEVYAVIDGREVRVATIDSSLHVLCGHDLKIGMSLQGLLEVADEQGYWERPHEVRFVLSPRPVSHGEVARAMLVGQKYVERKVSPMGGKTYFAEYTLQHGQRSVDIMRTADVLPVIMVDALERDAVK